MTTPMREEKNINVSETPSKDWGKNTDLNAIEKLDVPIPSQPTESWERLVDEELNFLHQDGYSGEWALQKKQDIKDILHKFHLEAQTSRDEQWRKAIQWLISNSDGSQDWFNGLRACKSIEFPKHN